MDRIVVHLSRAGLVAAGLVIWLVPPAASAQTRFTVAPGGPSGLASEFIYENIGGVPTPVAGGPGILLGPGDAIDGFSDNKSDVEFLLCFSVDAASVGAPLAPVFGIPLSNVFTEGAAGNMQAAGDGFITTEAFTRGGITVGLPSLGLFNNTVAINQSPVDKNDFGLLPVASPGVFVPGLPLDDIVGGGGGAPVGGAIPLFFTLDAASPSLGVAPLLPGSGADIFFDGDASVATGAGVPAGLFASAAALMLLAGDEIDALVVFDDDLDGIFSGTDQVLFSLAAGSPSLIVLGASPADVLSVTFGGVVGVFATAASLGLDPLLDELDMLELVPFFGPDAGTTIANKIPEPSTALLLATGLATLAWRVRRA